MAVKLTFFPMHLLLSQTLLTPSQATDYNPRLLGMSTILVVVVWRAHLAQGHFSPSSWLWWWELSPAMQGPAPSLGSAPTQGLRHSWHSRFPRKSLIRLARTCKLCRRTAQIVEERSARRGGGSYAKVWLDRPKKRRNISPHPLSGDPDDWTTVETRLVAKKRASLLTRSCVHSSLSLWTS